MRLMPCLLIGLLGFPVACKLAKNSSSETRIVGGILANESDPVTRSTVALISGGGSFCSGTIIGPRHILSAAHCFAGTGGLGTSASFGPTAGVGATIPVVQAFVHEGYVDAEAVAYFARSPVNDIALLILASDIPPGYQIAPIPPLNMPIPTGAPVLLAGFGITQTNGDDTGVLRQVMSIMGPVNQAALELDIGPTPGKGTCQGDSGGPAYFVVSNTLYVFGVTSRGPECEEGVGTYTDARQFVTWLQTKGNFQVQSTVSSSAPNSASSSVPNAGQDAVMNSGAPNTVGPNPGMPAVTAPINTMPAKRQ